MESNEGSKATLRHAWGSGSTALRDLRDEQWRTPISVKRKHTCCCFRHYSLRIMIFREALYDPGRRMEGVALCHGKHHRSAWYTDLLRCVHRTQHSSASRFTPRLHLINLASVNHPPTRRGPWGPPTPQPSRSEPGSSKGLHAGLPSSLSALSTPEPRRHQTLSRAKSRNIILIGTFRAQGRRRHRPSPSISLQPDSHPGTRRGPEKAHRRSAIKENTTVLPARPLIRRLLMCVLVIFAASVCTSAAREIPCPSPCVPFLPQGVIALPFDRTPSVIQCFRHARQIKDDGLSWKAHR